MCISQAWLEGRLTLNNTFRASPRPFFRRLFDPQAFVKEKRRSERSAVFLLTEKWLWEVIIIRFEGEGDAISRKNQKKRVLFCRFVVTKERLQALTEKICTRLITRRRKLKRLASKLILIVYRVLLKIKLFLCFRVRISSRGEGSPGGWRLAAGGTELNK